MDIYVGTVWYRRLQQGYNGLWRDTYTRRIYKLSAASVDDFKQQVLGSDGPARDAIEFGPIGLRWSKRTLY